MKWKEPYEELPKTKIRCLAYCSVDKATESNEWTWKGYVDVVFDPAIGWGKREDQSTDPIYVLFWTEHPGCPKEE